MLRAQKQLQNVYNKHYLMMLCQHAVLIVLRDVLIRLGVVLICIMSINLTSSTGSQCENSTSLVLLIFV